MKSRYISILFFILLLGIFSFILIKFSNYFNYPSAKEHNSLDYEISEIREENDRFCINVYYPTTEYENLNNEVNDLILSYIEYFKEEVIKFSKEKKYSLNITFECQKYLNYTSYIFNIKMGFQCLHNEEFVKTITYDINNNKLIHFSDLIYKNQDLLLNVSKHCYEDLSSRDYIAKLDSNDFIAEGTSPVISNFENFSLYNNKLIIYFNEYQIVPYYLGIQKVEISLSDINI